MTDKETLFFYRLKQAEETYSEAKKMVDAGFSARSIVNRAYYTVFYTLMALFIKTDVNIKTSRHTGVISLFDREFVKTEKVDKRYSKIVHDIFDARQEGDYKELVDLSPDDASEFIKLAGEFLTEIKSLINKTVQ